MDIPPITLPAPSRHEEMRSKAEELEATFLSEMLGHSGLGHSGLGGTDSSFSGGAGETQFASFLRQEQARLMVEGGGIGLAELIFRSMVGAEHGNA